MADHERQCAHPGCSCPAKEGSKYCGAYCEGAERHIGSNVRLRASPLRDGALSEGYPDLGCLNPGS